ncbi:MAG: chemotaxis protein CheC [Ruminococcus sp.]|nr:chemotaxis protein CheC [Ruminococcus sp.]MCM1479012.1 chemotaxis protein CheC [Muribaculaceae bacterium]
MSLNNVSELQDMHLDVLKEIGNIGSGNAASSLAEFLQVTTDITVPSVKLLDFSETVNFLGGPENVAIGMLVGIKGDITGMILYVLEQSFASKMTKALFGTEIEDLYNMNDMEKSVIQEVGNIMAASYMNALASLTGMVIDISVPTLTVDMVGAILSVPAIEFAQVGDKVLFIDDRFVIDNSEVKSNMILVPELSSLETLFEKLGVSV